MPAYPLTLTVDHRSAQEKITIINAQGQTMIEGNGLMGMFKSKIELTADQNRGPCRYVMASAKSGFQLNAPLDIWDERGRSMGTIQRQQWWSSCYQIDDMPHRTAFSIQAQNPQQAWATRGFAVLFVLALLCSVSLNMGILGYCLIGVALLGLFLINTGHLLNAPYWVERVNGRRVMQFTKHPSINDGRHSFTIRASDAFNEAEELAILCGIILIALNHHGERPST
jgi:hypothetical protein